MEGENQSPDPNNLSIQMKYSFLISGFEACVLRKDLWPGAKDLNLSSDSPLCQPDTELVTYLPGGPMLQQM